MIHVIHDGTDTDAVRPDAGAVFRVPESGLRLSAQDEVVTYATRSLEPFRGFHIFMRALPEIQRRRPQAHVVVAGRDDTTYSPPLAGKTYRRMLLEQLAGRIDPSRVHFTGLLPGAEFLRLLQVSSAHVYLTYPYTLSWSLTDALAAGCLVVASRTGPVIEAIDDGRNGLLFDFFSPQELAARVIEALENRAAMLPLREAARRSAVERYDFAGACLPAYRELLHSLDAT